MTTRLKKPVVNHSRVVCRNACPCASIYLMQYGPPIGGIYSIPYMEGFVNTPLKSPRYAGTRLTNLYFYAIIPMKKQGERTIP